MSASNIERPWSPWPHRLAIVLAAATLLLMLVGGTVTSLNAGDTEPSWSLRFWEWFQPPSQLLEKEGHIWEIGPGRAAGAGGLRRRRRGALDPRHRQRRRSPGPALPFRRRPRRLRLSAVRADGVSRVADLATVAAGFRRGRRSHLRRRPRRRDRLRSWRRGWLSKSSAPATGWRFSSGRLSSCCFWSRCRSPSASSPWWREPAVTAPASRSRCGRCSRPDTRSPGRCSSPARRSWCSWPTAASGAGRRRGLSRAHSARWRSRLVPG